MVWGRRKIKENEREEKKKREDYCEEGEQVYYY